MSVIPEIQGFFSDLTAIRHDLHAHPEIGFEEKRTAAIVAEELRGYGLDAVHEGIGVTGVVGVLNGTAGAGRTIGLRADMDALPMEEHTNLAYRSQNPGRFHGCGHDGHTTMLLGAARYLAANRDFKGTAMFVFQPAEEGLGGARAMIADRLFERFPCDEIYGLHNSPEFDLGEMAIFPGKAMAGAKFFDIAIKASGSHAAMPNKARDAAVIAMTLGQSLQTIVSRNVDPLKPAVLSITKINAGSAYNVIPETAALAGTIRFFHDDVGDLVASRMHEIASGLAQSFGCEIDVDIRDVFSVLENHPAETEAMRQAACEIVGDDKVYTGARPTMGSEDFADMLHVVPGAYCWVGHGGTVPLHNPGFVLDDAILPIGASLLARMVQRRLAA
ncbi:M20 family metallopeptidase [Jiella sp. MQZ9-1]|uniref:Amidohydrolase n=1 Tax=Jiella flava TaxID=2816857 RepID=A0A939G0L7_9HYPH|nr:M20 aminoacylase family protein [Jiella flava]MBO0663640.1 amidohydrolase [Jiella flava]MCD2472215.1 M20 family metallopeptidase [Jiella flava]